MAAAAMGDRARPDAASIARRICRRAIDHAIEHSRHPARAARGLSIARATDFLTLPLWSRGVLLPGPKLPLTARVAVLCAATQYVIIEVRDFPHEPRLIRTLQAQPSSYRPPHWSSSKRRAHPCSRKPRMPPQRRRLRPRRNLPPLLRRLRRAPRLSRNKHQRLQLVALSCPRPAWSRRPSGGAPRTPPPRQVVTRQPPAPSAHAGAGRGPAEPGVRHGPAEHSDADRRNLL